MHFTYPNTITLVSALVLSATLARGAEPATDQSLENKIDALEDEVRQLKAQQGALRQQQQQTALDNAARDSDASRALLGVRGLTAGYSDGGFLLRSEDGNFLLHPWLQFQFRNTTSYRENGKAGGKQDDTQTGFEVRRLKFGVDGNLFSTDLTYLFQFAVDRKSGNVQLEQAWAKYHLHDSPFAIRAGQFKDPLDHEQLAASRYFPAVERTFIDDVFANAEGFVKGVSAIYDPGNIVRAEAAFTGGLRNFNTNFQQFPTTGIPTNWGAAGRVEYKAFGGWRDYDQITAYGIRRDTLVFGAGADYTETGHSDALVHVGDVQYQTKSGWSLYGAYLGRYTARNTAAKGADTYDPTARFQVAWAIDSHWEPYARYEYVHFDRREFAAHTQTNVQVMAAGVNYYLYGTSAKISVDVSYLPSGSPINDDGSGTLVDNGHGEVVGRVQLQIVL